MSEKYRPAFADPKGSLIGGPGTSTGYEFFGYSNGAPTAGQGGWNKGAIVVDITNGIAYRNDGSVTSATWTKLVGVGDTVATLTVTTLTTPTLNPTNIVRASQTFQAGRGGTAKAGTTAGFVVNAGNNLGTIATVAAGQTSATLVIALPNLHVGDTITGFSLYSSINSAGNVVTLDGNLRSLTVAAGATGTDASIVSMTQVSVSGATASSATKSGLSTVVLAGVNYYLLLTCTTGASTTLELSQVEVTVTTA